MGLVLINGAVEVFFQKGVDLFGVRDQLDFNDEKI